MVPNILPMYWVKINLVINLKILKFFQEGIKCILKHTFLANNVFSMKLFNNPDWPETDF